MLTDEQFNGLEWIEACPEILKGFTVTEAEPVTPFYKGRTKEPGFCGVVLYGKDQEGHSLAIDIGAYDELDEDQGLYIFQANIEGEAAG